MAVEWQSMAVCREGRRGSAAPIGVQDEGEGDPGRLGFRVVLCRCASRFGRLTEEEIEGIARLGTVGEFAELLAKAAAEGREKGKSFAESRGMRLRGRLVRTVAIGCLAYSAWSAVAWIVRWILAPG